MNTAANTVHCPSCGTTLRLKDTSRTDVVVKCPHCAEKFSPANELASQDTMAKVPDVNHATLSLPPGRVAAKAAPKLKPADTQSDDDEDGEEKPARERPHAKKHKKKKHDSSGTMKLILGGVALLFIVGGASAVAVILVNRDKTQTVAEVDTKPTNPDKDKQPPGRDSPVPNTDKKAKDAPPARVLPALPSGKPVVGTQFGNLAPEIVTEDLNGSTFKLSDFRGKVVVLFFWGDWCPYCRKCFPHQKEMVLKNAGRPFSILGINSDATKADAKRGLQREQLNWPSWFDGKDGPISRQWGVNSYPVMVLVDAKGIVRTRLKGYSEDNLKLLATGAEELLREAEAKPR